jgi:homocysteine S-methyltransferase
MMSLKEALSREGCLLLDGGLATTLESYGCDLRNKLWSASVLISDPQLVLRTHKAFVDDGCDVVTTCSYQLTLQARPDDGADLLRRSVQLARESGARFVAASVGSFGAYLADGSEYTGTYGLKAGAEAMLKQFHAERVKILRETGPDVLLFETIPCLAEARALIDLLVPGDVACVSFQCRDDSHLGEKLFSVV